MIRAPGATVAIMLPTSLEFFYTFYGILLAGAIPVPIYPPARLSQLEDHLRRQCAILQSAQAVVMVTVPEARLLAGFLRAEVRKGNAGGGLGGLYGKVLFLFGDWLVFRNRSWRRGNLVEGIGTRKGTSH